MQYIFLPPNKSDKILRIQEYIVSQMQSDLLNLYYSVQNIQEE